MKIIAKQYWKKFGFWLFVILIIFISRTWASAASCPLKTGRPYKTNSSSAVWFVTPACKKVAIRNSQVYFSHFKSWNEVKVIRQSALNKIPKDPAGFLAFGPRRTYANGTLLKQTGEPTMYQLINGILYPFDSEKIFVELQYDPKWVEEVTPSVVSQFEKGELVTSTERLPKFFVFKYENSPDVYATDYDDSRQLVKRHIVSYDDFIRFYRSDRIAVLPTSKIFTEGQSFTVSEPGLRNIQPSLSASPSREINSIPPIAQSTTTINPPQLPAFTASSSIPQQVVNFFLTPGTGGGGGPPPASPQPSGRVNMRISMLAGAATTTPSTTVSFTITYANEGTADASGVVISQTVPAHSSFFSASSTGSWTCPNSGVSGDTCSLNAGSVPVGSSGSLVFALTPSSSFNGTLSHSVAVTDDGAHGSDADASDNGASAELSVNGIPDIQISYSSNTATTTASSTVLYTIGYTNAGTIDAPGVSITATVPSGTVFLAASSTGSWSCLDGAAALSTCTSTVGTVGIRQSGSRSFAVKEVYNFPFMVSSGGQTLYNYAVTSTARLTLAADNGAESNTSDNDATSTVQITMVPLTDMVATGITYKGYTGGLYPNSSNTMPTVHSAEGVSRMNQISPLDINGNPTSTGKIVLLSIGLSNTTMEWCAGSNYEWQNLGFVNAASAYYDPYYGCGNNSNTPDSPTSGTVTFMGKFKTDSRVNRSGTVTSSSYLPIAPGYSLTASNGRGTLYVVNGARSGQAAIVWTSPTATAYYDITSGTTINTNSYPLGCSSLGIRAPNTSDPTCVQIHVNNYDIVRDARLTPQGLSENQVQIVWLKVVDGFANASRPMLGEARPDAFVFETYLGQIIRSLKIRYPNLKQVFISNRIYSYGVPGSLSPEPFAYESGFSIKWLIESQINQMANGGTLDNSDPNQVRAGDLNYNNGTAPWIAWGPYLWAYGTMPRAASAGSWDPAGLSWTTSDVLTADYTHPNNSGIDKVSNQLFYFFLGSPWTCAWFTANGTCN